MNAYITYQSLLPIMTQTISQKKLNLTDEEMSNLEELANYIEAYHLPIGFMLTSVTVGKNTYNRQKSYTSPITIEEFKNYIVKDRNTVTLEQIEQMLGIETLPL